MLHLSKNIRTKLKSLMLQSLPLFLFFLLTPTLFTGKFDAQAQASCGSPEYPLDWCSGVCEYCGVCHLYPGDGGQDCCKTDPNCTDTPAPCFPAGTKVTLPNNSTKNIEDVRPGDKVLSEDEAGKQYVSTVQSVLSPISNNLCQIKYMGGKTLDVTKGHPLFTQNGWKAIDKNIAAQEDPEVPVSTLNVGDFMKNDAGSWDQVANISCKDETVQTYNLTVDNAHTYFAGGFLAHNKSRCTGCYPTDGRGLWPVTDLAATQINSTSVQLNWSYGQGDTCANHSNIAIFVGRTKEAVAANCGVASENVGSVTWPDVEFTPNGGLGGGGSSGSTIFPSTAAVPGTGGGGGADASGGSGIVIVSYPTGSLTAAGGSITSSGGYTIHTFTSSGTFTVTSGQTTSATLLVVAGGGAGGGSGGGGGAGGTILQSNYSLSPQSYVVVVGNGGVGLNWRVYYDCWSTDTKDVCGYVIGGDGQARPGGNSSFGTVVATGGGGGGSNALICTPNYKSCRWSNPKGGNGGSGGGGAVSAWYGTTAPGIGTAGQGSNGGIDDGGGGGRTQIGLNGYGGKGGDGIASNISGASQYYGGGGGGQTSGDHRGCYQMRKVGSDTRNATITNLEPGVIYWFRVVSNYDSYDKRDESYEGHYCGGDGPISAISCTVTVNPSSYSLPEGQTVAFTTTVAGLSGTPTVKYSSVLPYFQFNPESTDNATNLYESTLAALQQTLGSQSFTVGAYANAKNLKCLKENRFC